MQPSACHLSNSGVDGVYRLNMKSQLERILQPIIWGLCAGIRSFVAGAPTTLVLKILDRGISGDDINSWIATGTVRACSLRGD